MQYNTDGTRAKFDRLYANGLMYLARGERALAEKYLSEALHQLREYVLSLPDALRDETREWFLELCAHIKDIRQCSDAPKTEEAAECIGGGESFAFPKEEVPSVSFDDVIGLDAVKEQIYDMVIYPRRYGELYARFRKKAGGGILLYGPPGNGKTMIAKAIAHETDSTFFPIKFSDVGSKWFGESEGKIKDLFEEARREKNAVIFFDEIDALATCRNESSVMDRLVAELLTQMDGINRAGGNLTVLAATNRPEKLDPAILRPGRLDEKIFVPLPNACAREQMLVRRLCDIPSTVADFAALAALCDGFSGAEIDRACEKAKQSVIRRIIAGGMPDLCITDSDMREAISALRAG